MNERIKELAVQAGYTRLPGFDFANELQDVFLKKFAERIIRECITVIEETNDRYRKEYFADKIREHFGVEE